MCLSGAPYIGEFGYLCIQEIFCTHKVVLTYVGMSVHPPIPVGGCEMALLLAWTTRHILSVFDLVLDIHVMVN